MAERTSGWTPFRPRHQDEQRIAGEVAAIAEIQAELVARHPDLKMADRVAHQYQPGFPVCRLPNANHASVGRMRQASDAWTRA
jgi:hypothetical protein